MFGQVVGEYLQKWSVTLAMFGRCEQSGYNLATIQPTIQLIIAIKQGLNQRQARWSLYLARFDFMLHHKPGQSMGQPNVLSHRADHRSGQGNNDNLTLLSLTLFRIHALSGTQLEDNEHNILKEVRQSL
jgi:hypothetical protein